ncbi:MAG: hypothetical protein CL565_06975 [Alphaproteobacteria bacterium]|nr:hypothetical protein [Alphaproteobacteria bacterium]
MVSKVSKAKMIFSGVTGLALMSACSAEEPVIGLEITGSEETLEHFDRNVLRYIQENNTGAQILVLNRYDVSANGNVTAEDLENHLTHRGVSFSNLTDDELNDFALALEEEDMVAQKSVDRETGKAELCLVSIGKSTRSLSGHISELSSIPETLIEQMLGTSEKWYTAKLVHEISHCLQPYRKRTMWDFNTAIDIEFGADKDMFKALQGFDSESYAQTLRLYRAARAIASVHYTSVSHHTNAGLILPNEQKLETEVSSELILEQRQAIEDALEKRVSILSNREDLLLRAVEEQIDYETRWNSKSLTIKSNEDILNDAGSMSPAEFIDYYGNENSFISGVQENLSKLIKNERNSYDTYEVFYNAAQSLLEENFFAGNTYASRFLEQYVDAIETFMPSVKKRPYELTPGQVSNIDLPQPLPR